MNCVYGQAGVRYVITKFSRMDSLPIFVTHGAPMRALRVRESSAINSSVFLKTLELKVFMGIENVRVVSKQETQEFVGKGQHRPHKVGSLTEVNSWASH